jgi:hypothetical protein
MDSYQRFALSPEFRPRSVSNVSQLLRQRASESQGDLSTFSGQIEQRNQNLIQDSQLAGRDLEALAQFSKTALDYVEKQFKRTIKDKEIGAQFASIYDPNIDVTEYQTILEGENQQRVAGAASNIADEQGDEVAAEQIQIDLNQIGRGLANEKALLYDARDRYAAEVLQIVNSEGLQNLYRTNPSAAIDVATKLFIEKYGLQNTTKANFVEILAPTIRSTNTYIAQNKVTEQIKELKAERLSDVDRKAFSLMSSSNPQQTWRELTERYVYENNGVNSFSAANARLAKLSLSAAASTGNVGFVEKVGGIFTKPGQAGTELMFTFPAEYSKALSDVTRQADVNRRNNRAAVITQLSNDLDGAPFEQRAGIIQKAIDSLKGDLPGQRQIRSMFQDIQADSTNAQRTAELQTQQAQGKLLDDRSINALVSSGEITPTQGNKLRTQRNGITQPGKKAVTASIRTVTSDFKNKLSLNTGLTVDPSGYLNLVGLKPSQTPIGAKRANTIANQFRSDLDARLSEFMLTLDYANMSPKEINDAILQEARTFYKEATGTGGLYELGGVFSFNTYPKPDSEEFTSVKRAADAFTGLPAERADLPSGATDWSGDWSPSTGWRALEGKYKPGDILYSEFEAKNLLTEVSTKGVTDMDLVKFAQRNYTTVTALLNEHAAAYGEPFVTSLDKGNILKMIPPQSTNGNPNEQKYEKTAAAAIPAFLAAGMTPQGAAMAAAYMRFNAQRLYLDRKDPDYFLKGTFVDDFMLALDEEALNLFTNPRVTLKDIAYNLSKFGQFGYQDYVPMAKRLLNFAGYQQ